jgi:hypothetical protein
MKQGIQFMRCFLCEFFSIFGNMTGIVMEIFQLRFGTRIVAEFFLCRSVKSLIHNIFGEPVLLVLIGACVYFNNSTKFSSYDFCYLF